MPLKQSIDTIARSYALLWENLPELEIDPRNWGPKALEILSTMAKTGPIFREAASYLIREDIALYNTQELKGVGAGWHENFAGERWISIDHSIGFTHSLILIGHEAHHMRQSIRERCSVEGEYSAWRIGFKLRTELSGTPLTGDEQLLASMPDNPTREDLKKAQQLIQKMAGPDYLIGKAPLQAEDWETALMAPFVKFINTILRRGEML
ncbi:MAG: hypothetical protein JW748_01305 [Anaerolineales bacterium]|nr:hypothetical protein [Anaerolineales bacterium]